jgi:hypothetical protein
MDGRRKPYPLSEKDGPFKYVYLAITAVPGMRLPDKAGADIEFSSFPDGNAKAFFTLEWDTYCVHMDRSDALACLMLSGFRGRTRFGRFSEYLYQLLVWLVGAETMFRRRLDRETTAARERRHKTHNSPGCYLIYQAEGDVIEPVKFDAARRFGKIGFAIDAIRGILYRELHRPALHSTVTALSLALVDSNGSPDTHFIGDMIYLSGRDGLTVYSRTLQEGTLSVTVSALSDPESLRTANRFIPAIIKERRIATAISLFVQSQKKESDNLRSFIAAWSALELVINLLCKLVREDWERLLTTDAMPSWDKDLTRVTPDDYRMRDRFFSVACVLDLGAASADSKRFAHANDVRSKFYHRMDIQERELPTDDVQNLFRKYLRLYLSL